MVILATSDFHGYLPFVKEPFDLLLICGDICPAYCHAASFQKDWINDEFVKWVNGLPFKTDDSKVILTPGNHDFYFERAQKNDLREIESATSNRLKILKHGEYDYDVIVSDGLDTIKIFGTPYCSIFGNWAFMVSDETLEKKFSQIPDDVDILISHDSPNINGLGDITEGPFQKEDTGNNVLAKHIERIKPKIFVSGHFHSGNHKFEKVGDTYMANVSLVNEYYQPVNPILKIEYDEETRTVIGNSLIFS